MFIRDPGSWILIFTHPEPRISDPGSRIPDPKTATTERGEIIFVVLPFLYPQISQNLNLFYFVTEDKKLGKFTKYYRTFYPTIANNKPNFYPIVIKLSKI